MFSIFSNHPIISTIVGIIILIVLLCVRSYKKTLSRLKKWEVDDTLCLNPVFKNYNWYKSAELYSSRFSGKWNKGALVRLVKWNDDECLVKLGDGSEYYIKMDSISSNWSLFNRERNNKMDDFMKDIPSTKQEVRDDKINNILK